MVWLSLYGDEQMQQLDQMIPRLSWNLERGERRIPVVSTEKLSEKRAKTHLSPSSSPSFALLHSTCNSSLFPPIFAYHYHPTASKHSIPQQKGENADAFFRPLHAIALYLRRATVKPNPTFPPLRSSQILQEQRSAEEGENGRKRAK